MTEKEILDCLCYYDKRNPEGYYSILEPGENTS